MSVWAWATLFLVGWVVMVLAMIIADAFRTLVINQIRKYREKRKNKRGH